MNGFHIQLLLGFFIFLKYIAVNSNAWFWYCSIFRTKDVLNFCIKSMNSQFFIRLISQGKTFQRFAFITSKEKFLCPHLYKFYRKKVEGKIQFEIPFSLQSGSMYWIGEILLANFIVTNDDSQRFKNAIHTTWEIYILLWVHKLFFRLMVYRFTFSLLLISMIFICALL